jgi:hypothetical protein
MKVAFIVSVAALRLSGASKAADNAACWDDATRVEISCTPLTEKLLTSLKFASRQRAIKSSHERGSREALFQAPANLRSMPCAKLAIGAGRGDETVKALYNG